MPRKEGRLSPLDELRASVSLDAVLWIKRTGVLVGGWAGNAIQGNVASVMAATLLSSADILLESLGCRTPQSVFLAAKDVHIFATKVNGQLSLLLVAPGAVSEEDLAREAHRLAASPPDLTSREHERAVVVERA